MPVRLPFRRIEGGEVAAGQVVAEDAGGELRGGGHLLNRASRLDTEAMEQVEQTLGGEVAGGPRRVRAAAEAARRAVEAGDTGLQAGIGVRQRRAARVVQMEGDLLD